MAWSRSGELLGAPEIEGGKADRLPGVAVRRDAADAG